MATTPTKPDIAAPTPLTGISGPVRVRSQAADPVASAVVSGSDISRDHAADLPPQKPSQRDALQALLAFSSLHDQVRRRKALAARSNGFDAATHAPEFEQHEQFVLDEVLQLVAERAVAITGADGLAIALAENNEIVLRAAAGAIRPDVGARIDRDSAFSGACFRAAQIVICDDTETDPKVNVAACRKLGARSMVAVPLCGRRRVIGVLEAFSEWPFAFNESDVRNLSLLAELVLGALKPEDEDRFAESAQAAATRLDPAPRPSQAATAVTPPKVLSVAPPASIPASLAPNTNEPKPPAPSSVAPTPAAPLPAAKNPIVPAAVVPVVTTKASEPVPQKKIDAASAPAIPDKLAAKASDTLPATSITATAPSEAVETPGAPEVATPALVIQDADSHRRPVMLILLVCILIGTALAGGVWWKMKRDLGRAMIHMDKMPVKPAATDSTKDSTKDLAKDVPAAPLPPPANSGTAADATSEASEPDSVPATAQELSKFPRVTGIRHWSSADSSTVVLDLQDQVQYEAHRLAGPDRIYFDLRDTQLAADLVGKSIEVGDTFIGRIRMAQPVAGMTRIVLETKANSTFSVSLEPNPYRLVVEVRKIGSNPKGAVNLFPNSTAEAEKNKLAIVVPPPTKEDFQLRARVPKMRIVVDAGHGGWDLGTVGRRGLLEKDLVLEIAQRLGKLLESRLGTEVIYTRQDDNYIPLDERASIANQSQADLFISVHANYSDLPSARGVETYYTNFFSAPGSKEAGAKDVDSRATTTAAAAKPALITLSASDLHERIEQSRRLAASVQRSLYGTLSVQNPGLRDRGIKEAGFVVLTESAMPGILAEVSFVSSPTDEQKLRSDGYREQIAEALYKGIARYAATSRGVKVAAK
jgi:N-acetylmuramoyl-L-alanine amidase/putative methionine-R-sulfoxide reductase with GAF domain